MAAGLPTIASQEPVDLGGGFEDPMDPCTMCMQGQQEIQQAYNELTQSCNACQTQQNLTNLQQQGCQGCAQAQQVIQKVQQQSTGCASCGQQPTTFTNLNPALTPSGSQPMVTGTIQQPPTSQGLVQPMLTPLTGTAQNVLSTVMTQPGMTAGQLPIAIERGPTTTTVPTFTGGMLTMQPMVAGATTTTTSQPTQGVNFPGGTPTPTLAPTGQPQLSTPGGAFQAVQGLGFPGGTPTPMLAPTGQPQLSTPGGAFQSVPVMQPVITPPPMAPPPAAPVSPPPVVQPAPTGPGFSFPTNQGIAQSFTTAPITGVGAGATGYGAGGGKAGPGSAGGIAVNSEGQLVYAFNIAAGPGVGNTGVSGLAGGFGPGAFDTHRPDLHKGGPWHFVMPLGTDAIFNLL